MILILIMAIGGGCHVAANVRQRVGRADPRGVTRAVGICRAVGGDLARNYPLRPAADLYDDLASSAATFCPAAVGAGADGGR